MPDTPSNQTLALLNVSSPLDRTLFPLRPGRTHELQRVLAPLTATARSAAVHPATYAMRASKGNWLPAPHQLLVANFLFAASCRLYALDRLAVSMPPRHGKSQLVSDYFPAWHLTLFPEREVMQSSYSQDFVEGWSLMAQQHFAENFEACNPEGWQKAGQLALHPRHKGADSWWLPPPLHGRLHAAGVGGVLTGKGFHAFLGDDLIKSQQEADSETMRERIFDWLQGTALTRGEPGSWACLLGTRWHYDDVYQRTLDWAKEHADEGAPPWYIINLPAIADEDEELYAPWDPSWPIWVRKEGEALWPERWPVDAMKRLRAERHPRIWNAQYQGKPTAKGGDLYKAEYYQSYREQLSSDAEGRIHRYFDLDGKLVAERDCYTFGTMDVAGTVKTSSDWTAVGIWTVTPDKDLLLRLVKRIRLESPDQPAFVRDLIRQWLLSYMGIEDRTFGTSLIQTLVREGLPIRPLKADTDKIARSFPMSLMYLHGKVWHPKSNAPWLSEYERELCQFPYGKHDDQCDMAAYAGICVSSAVRPHLDTVDAPTPTDYTQARHEWEQMSLTQRQQAVFLREAGLDED